MPNHSYLIATNLGDGAVPDHFVALSEELSRRGNRVALVTARARVPVRNPAHGVEVFEWPNPRPITSQDARFMLSLSTVRQPDCVVGNFGAVNVFALVNWLTRVPVRIMWYHTLSSQIDKDASVHGAKIALLRLRKAFVYWTATHIFANSLVARDDIIRTFWVHGDKCSRQTLSLLDPLGGASRGDYSSPVSRIACVARFSPSKGQDVLIRALGRLGQNENWLATFVGDGPYRQASEALASELGISSKCRFVGQCGHKEVLQHLKESDISVVPSLSEAYGFAALESMAVGLPVVASRTGGLAETIRDGIDGLLFGVGSDHELSSHLTRLLGGEGLRRRFGLAARQRFMDNFERGSVIPAQADFMQEVVARGASAYRRS